MCPFTTMSVAEKLVIEIDPWDITRDAKTSHVRTSVFSSCRFNITYVAVARFVLHSTVTTFRRPWPRRTASPSLTRASCRSGVSWTRSSPSPAASWDPRSRCAARSSWRSTARSWRRSTAAERVTAGRMCNAERMLGEDQRMLGQKLRTELRSDT